MAFIRTSPNGTSAHHGGMKFSDIDLQDTGRLGRLAAGALLILLGATGRSTLAKLGFTLGGAVLLTRAMGGRPAFRLPGRVKLGKLWDSRNGHGVMRADQPLAQQRTRGGGVPDQSGVKLIRSISIDRPREEVYSFWKNIENLPRFMAQVESIHQLDERHSHWVVSTPAGSTTAEWYMEIINDHPNEMIAWQSLPGSDLPNAGSVRFATAPNGGTIVRVTMEYHQPTLGLGAAASEILGDQPDQQLLEDLGRLKFILESPEERNRLAPLEDMGAL